MKNRLQQFMPDDKYQDKVLLGNWVERRRSYVKHPHDFKTNYSIDYCPKPNTTNDPKFLRDQQYRGLGYNARVLYDHQGNTFLENKSTTYDISYNHLPKKSPCGPLPREIRFRMGRYEPEQDYAQNFGNVTKTGLLDYYREKWRCEIQDPRKTLQSSYKETFTAPKHERSPSWGIPLANSSAMEASNRRLYHLRLRGKQRLAVPEKVLVQLPYVRRCNPITWECPKHM
ncbi:hypothetical protein PPYR_12360 [Photinus pyralis]|uniref:Uncharacterized protein n=1 Tax=Photinus pyralis TaxID=7054 RepID=A0A5N4ADY6_PHOPY|nr:uncharacterized protein C1orf158 homolog [Photinus pyralis]KAB0795521.1 hypothetical protein PPYR_12360 [Photinus pyralis]